MNKTVTKTANQLLKERSVVAILDAARQCYVENGISNTSIDEIAKRASVGRTTFYRNFKTKRAVTEQLIFLDSNDAKTQLVNILAKIKNPTDCIVAGITFNVFEFPKTLLYSILFADEESIAVTRDLAIDSELIVAVCTEVLEPVFKMAKASGCLRKGITLPLMADWLIKLTFSFLMVPTQYQKDQKALKKYVLQFVIPSLFTEQA